MAWTTETRAIASERSRNHWRALVAAGVVAPKIDPAIYRAQQKAEVRWNRTLIESLIYGEAYAAGDYSKLENVWRPKPKPIKVKKHKVFVSRAKIVLSYPYLPKKREEHADLLAVNALVPRGMPGREDVCQEIMLAIWEGRTTLVELRQNRMNVRGFMARFRADNLEVGGYAISLDQPMHDGRSWHDVLSAEQAWGG